MKIAKNLAAIVALGTITIGGAGLAHAGVGTMPVEANDDSLTIHLANPSAMGGQTYTVNLLANDNGNINKTATTIVNPTDGVASTTGFTIGGTKYSLANGLLTLTTSKTTTLNDFKSVMYNVKATDGLSMGMANVTLNVSQLGDPVTVPLTTTPPKTTTPTKTPVTTMAVSDYLNVKLPKVGTKGMVTASVNLLANDKNVAKGSMVHLIDPSTGKHVTTLSSGVVTYTVKNGVLTVSAPASVNPESFVSVKYAIMNTNGSDSVATVHISGTRVATGKTIATSPITKTTIVDSSGSKNVSKVSPTGTMMPMTNVTGKSSTNGTTVKTLGPMVQTDFVK